MGHAKGSHSLRERYGGPALAFGMLRDPRGRGCELRLMIEKRWWSMYNIFYNPSNQINGQLIVPGSGELQPE
jgi:hypothetical protein